MQDPAQHPAPPSLQQALAVALLLRRRTSAAVAEAQERCTRLEAEADALRSGAVAPDPLAQVVAPPPLGAALPGRHGATQASWAATPAAASLPGDAGLQASQQHEALALWHAAATALPPSLQPTLAQAQSYMLLSELQRGGAPGRLPLLAALDRTPVRALLELAADILQAHAARTGSSPEVGAGGAAAVVGAGTAAAAAHPATAAAAAAVSGAASAASRSATHPAHQHQYQHQHQHQHHAVHLTPAHGALLASAAACIAQLCDRPGEAAAHADFECLQIFCPWLLQLATTPAPSPAAAGAPPQPQQAQQPASAGSLAAPAHTAPTPDAAAAPAGTIDLRQPASGVAQAVLALLRQSGPAGITLLSCCAPATRDCMLELVEAVLGEQPLMGAGPGGSAAAAAAAAAEEARLLQRFLALAGQLSAGLRLLPQWAQALSLFDEAFMNVRPRAGGLGELAGRGWKGGQHACMQCKQAGAAVRHRPTLPRVPQGVADAITSARDASQLIAVTHPEAARQMQRCTALMVGALQQIQAASGGA